MSSSYQPAPYNLKSSYVGKLPYGFKNNPKLLPANITLEWDIEQFEEFERCKFDPIYFIDTYCKIRTLDHGIQRFRLYPRQKELINLINDERFVICRAARQVGKSETAAAYMLWYALFNDQKFIAILANKEATAKEILLKVKRAFSELPFWLQKGVTGWNHTDISFENGSRIMAASTASDAIRGYTINFLFLDEFAHVENNQAEEFFQAVFPTITSGKTSKIVIVSTPKGYNLFWKLWDEASRPHPDYPGESKNGFKTFFFHYSEVPGRDAKWVEEQRAKLGPVGFRAEVLCDFLGSSMTLISADAMNRLSATDPLESRDGLDIYEQPQKDRAYVLVADTSRGHHLDYSAFIVFDITEMPYRIVAKFRKNDISTLFYPTVIHDVATRYNEAYLLIEINDAGLQVADILVTELEYENLFYTNKSRSPANQPEVIGNARQISFPGLRTTKPVKRIGCNAFKTLVELDHILIQDYHLIFEISTFVMSKESFEAEEGKNDDLVMCCVLFSWLTTQNFFKDLTNSDIRKKVLENMRDERNNMLLGIVVHNMDDVGDGMPQNARTPPLMKEDGDLWFSGKNGIDDVYEMLGIPKSPRF
jgi:hypothetical protein